MEKEIERKIKIKSQNMTQLSQYIDELRQNPRLTYLFLELTDRCNLRCRHCGSSCEPGGAVSDNGCDLDAVSDSGRDFGVIEGNDCDLGAVSDSSHNPGAVSGSAQGCSKHIPSVSPHMMDTDMALTLLQTVAEDFEPAGVMICLTGGEPFLHPYFWKITEQIQSLGFPWGITTNGTLTDETCARRCKEAGLESVTISLDGLQEEHDWLRQSAGAYTRTVRGIRNFQKAGIPVQITTVIHRNNLKDLEAMYEEMIRLEIDSWRIINIEPIGRAHSEPELLLNSTEMKSLLEFIRKKRYDENTPFDVCFGCSHYLSFEYEHEVRDNYFLCGSGIYVASVLVNGDIYSCLDIERRPELVQGNVRQQRFSKVWKEGFQAFRQDRTERNRACRECPERQFCGGDSTHTWDFDTNRPRFCILKRTEETV